jgi:hypothetical protein
MDVSPSFASATAIISTCADLTKEEKADAIVSLAELPDQLPVFHRAVADVSAELLPDVIRKFITGSQLHTTGSTSG